MAYRSVMQDKSTILVIWGVDLVLIAVALFLVFFWGCLVYPLAMLFAASITLVPVAKRTVVMISDWLSGRRKAQRRSACTVVGGVRTPRRKRSAVNAEGLLRPCGCPAQPLRPGRGVVLRELGISYEDLRRTRNRIRAGDAVQRGHKDGVTTREQRPRVRVVSRELIAQVRETGKVRVKANAMVKGHHGASIRGMLEADMHRLGVTDVTMVQEGKDLILAVEGGER